MPKAIDFHTNILFEKAITANPRMQELFERTRTNSLKKVKLINSKTLLVNKKANFYSLLNSMKKNNISNSVCFSYQWKKHSDCIKANNFIISGLTKSICANLFCLVVVQPKSKQAKYDLQEYLKNEKVLGLKIKPSWCGVNLSNLKYLGPKI